MTNQSMEKPVQQQALDAAVAKVNELFDSIRLRADTMQKHAVGICNECLQLGFQLQEATGREQLDLELFNHLPGKNSALNFNFARRCVSLVNRFGVHHEFQFAETQPELQLLFQGMNVLEAPKRAARLSAGSGGDRNWGSWIPTAFAPLNSELRELVESEPPEKWSEERRETFLVQTEFIANLRETIQTRTSEPGTRK